MLNDDSGREWCTGHREVDFSQLFMPSPFAKELVPVGNLQKHGNQYVLLQSKIGFYYARCTTTNQMMRVFLCA